MAKKEERKAPGFFEGFWLLIKYLYSKLRQIDYADALTIDPHLREAKQLRIEQTSISAPPPENRIQQLNIEVTDNAETEHERVSHH